jgi:drug/metabolite transporter (DMT)-like permease
MWPHGAEPALTLIPNFLAAGIVTIIVGAALIVWSIAGVHKPKGSTVFLILFLVLLFVGGGVAQVLFFPVFWLVSTRINSTLSWWDRAIPRAARGALSRVWAIALVIAAGLMSGTLYLAVTGYIPRMDDPEAVLSVMMFSLFSVMVLLPLIIVSGFAKDLADRKDAAAG